MQELLGSVANLSWDADRQQLSLTAACHLPPHTGLTPALLAVRADPTHLLHMHGPSALPWAQRRSTAQHNKPSSQGNNEQQTDSSARQLISHQDKANSRAPYTDSNTAKLDQGQDNQPEGGLNRLHARELAAQHQQTNAPAAMPWQASDAPTYELCLEPSQEGTERGYKLQLLHASSLGSSHFLTMQSSQVEL